MDKSIAKKTSQNINRPKNSDLKTLELVAKKALPPPIQPALAISDIARIGPRESG